MSSQLFHEKIINCYKELLATRDLNAARSIYLYNERDFILSTPSSRRSLTKLRAFHYDKISVGQVKQAFYEGDLHIPMQRERAYVQHRMALQVMRARANTSEFYGRIGCVWRTNRVSLVKPPCTQGDNYLDSNLSGTRVD